MSTQQHGFETSSEPNHVELKIKARLQTNPKTTLKLLLFILNVIFFIVSTLSLCLSFSEVKEQCVTQLCNLSHPNITSPLCEYTYNECYQMVKHKSYQGAKSPKYSYDDVTCQQMVYDLGCACDAVNMCGLIGETECVTYSCTTYCNDHCWSIKYTLFIMLVVCETLLGIPTYNTERWDEELEEVADARKIGEWAECSYCLYFCCCYSKWRGNIYIKIVQYLTTWMINWGIYSLTTSFFGADFGGWILIGMMVFVIAYFSYGWISRVSDESVKCCTLQNICDFSEYISKGVITIFGMMLMAIFFIMCFVHDMNFGFAFDVLLKIDFETKLYVGIHTIALLCVQIVNVIRNILECE
eukprot:92989_1